MPPVKLHAEQLSPMGGSELAARYGALSCDHIEHLTPAGVQAMREAGTVAVCFPWCFMPCAIPIKPPPPALRAAGVPMAVSTDHNPGTSPTQSLLLMMNMACTQFRLTVPEAMAGVTRHAAQALGLQASHGALHLAQKANLVFWQLNDWTELAYAFGTRPAKYSDSQWRTRLDCMKAPLMINRPSRSLFTPHALLPQGWAADVLLQWDAQGDLTGVQIGADSAARAGALCTPHPVIPGASHSLPRLSARLCRPDRSPWCWARESFLELAHADVPLCRPAQPAGPARRGHLAVCEHAGSGLHLGVRISLLAPSAGWSPLCRCSQMSPALLAAAKASGIGITLLPVLYQTAGFGAQPARAEQKRFLMEVDAMLALLARLQSPCATQGAALGLAPHSLRAVPPHSLKHALQGLTQWNPQAPVHIHIAEQEAEVQACLEWSGQRPVQWLCEHADVNARWCLVHATHMNADETQRAARSGAVAATATRLNRGAGQFDWTTSKPA